MANVSFKVHGSGNPANDLASLHNNLNLAIQFIEGKTHKGFVAAGLFLKGEAVLEAPTEFGLLRNSAFTSSEQIFGGSIVRVGFTAKYAAWVHEMPMINAGKPRKGKNHKGVYWQDGRNKFLERPLRENTDTILQIISNRAKF